MQIERDNPIAKAALAEAKERAGGTSNLAKAAKVRPQAVSQWTTCPVDKVLLIERAFGVPRWRLRPDIYPNDLTPERLTAIAGEPAT